MREFGSEFEIEYARDSYFDDICALKPYSALTRSGREAIGLAALAVEKGIVLMPAYCCWSMELPFTVAGHSVVYYRLNSDLSVDKDHYMEQLFKYKPKAVLLVDYFGFVTHDDIIHITKEYNPSIQIIEDFTQSLFSLDEKINPLVDVYVASIRKSLGVPDGGIVISSGYIDRSLLQDGNDTPFVTYHITAGRLKKRYAYNAEPATKASFRILQARANQDIKDNFGLYSMSAESMSVIKHTIVGEVKQARRDNYSHLYDLINSKVNVLFAPSETNPSPFMMPIIVEDRDNLQQLFAQEGLYTQVLWPLKEETRQICPMATRMEAHMLALPIDQRYDYYDIEEMSAIINRVIV